MKIRISDGQRGFHISIPNALALNHITARIVCSAARKHAPEAGDKLSPDALQAVFAELDRIKKKYGSWVLAEVESAKGTSIEITL